MRRVLLLALTVLALAACKEDAQDISIQRDRRLVKGEGPDSPRRIRPNTGQLLQKSRLARNLAVILLEDNAGRFP